MPLVSSTPTAFNFRFPDFSDAIVDSAGKPTSVEQKFRINLLAVMKSLATINAGALGARGDGRSDDTPAIQQAINQAIAQGGGIVFIPPGTFSINSIVIPAFSPPIEITGQGIATVLKRRGTLQPGMGLVDIRSPAVTLSNFVIDGATTVPVGLRYGADFNGIGGIDPMADSLTRNTSVWVHFGGDMFSAFRVIFQHAGGYSLLLDALEGDLEDIDILNCWFKNNRPTLFGLTTGPLIYGSWNGGIFIKGDGRTLASGVVRNLLVSQCRFSRNTGNCLWSHLYGLNRLHENFQFTLNRFIDCGLDGILVGGVTGGEVSDNVFRRVGYTTLTDTDQSVPRWLPNLQATALDSSGLVKGVPYANNSFLNINGGCLDLDGHGDSVISGNVCRVSYPGEPEYDEDQVAISGASGTGATSYGVNLGNTANTPWGAKNVQISSNAFINLSAGSVRMYGARDCHVTSNQIIAPDVPTSPPVQLGPVGPGVNQRSTGNRISHNRASYNPAAPAPLVFEDASVAPFLITDVNYVFGNNPIVGAGGLAVEFTKDVNSGSPVYAQTVWFP